MVKVHDNFEIPTEIWDKLSTGKYTRSGGVVRDNLGRIITILDPIELNKPKLMAVGVHILKLALKNQILVKEGLKIGTNVWIYVKFLDTFCLSFSLGQHPEWIVPHPK